METPLPANNYTIYSELTGKGLSKLSDEMTILGADKIYFIENNKNQPEVRFIDNIIKQKKQNYKFVDNNLILDSAYTIKFTDVLFSTKYSNIQKTSIIKREIGREINVNFKCKIYFRDSIVYSYYFDNKSDDIFDFTYLNYVEAGDMPFYKGEVPEASFWDKYFIPVTAVSASVIAVILFFVIRSK
jgi:hypothetical protein